MTALVAFGCKYGDLCNVSQIANHVPDSIVIIPKKYESIAPIFRNSEILDLEWHDLKGALIYAKRKYRKTLTVSTFGKDFDIRKRTASFQIDQWYRAGVLDRFNNPTVATNDGQIKKDGSIVIFADSESSPFPHIDDLIQIVKSHFKERKIIISPKSDVFLNLKNIMDAADAVICVESGPLHLSAFTKTPVFAFVTDHPSRWHGTAFHPRFKFHCRYSQYEKRKSEFVQSLANCLEGKPQIEVFEIKGLFDGAFNPSIIEQGGKILMAYRHQTKEKPSSIAIAELNDKFRVRRNNPLIVPNEISSHSLEDPHLFMHGEKFMMSYTVAVYPMPPFRCVVEYGELKNTGEGWKLVSRFRPKHGKNDFSALEKNWCFFSNDGNIYAIYKDGTVLQINEEKVERTFSHSKVDWKYGEKKGGCVIPHNGKLLRFFHSRTDDGEKPVYWHYRVGASLIDSRAPFNVISTTQEPVLTGTEEWCLSHYWKPNVVFPGSAIKSGEHVLLAYGMNDVACRIAKIPNSILP